MSNGFVVIDVSHYQKTPDWNAVKASGILGVIFKCTEGTGYLDPTYKQRKSAAKQAGLVVCSYHYLKRGSINQQMQWFVNNAEPVPGERLVIDFEDKDCSLDDLMQACQWLMNYAPPLEITVYGANGFLGALLAGKKNDFLGQFSLWVASYTSAAAPTMTDLKATWPNWTLWQKTDAATIPGFTGPVDGNLFNGSAENCLKWLMPATGAPPPAPTPDLETVTLTIASATKIKLVLNAGTNVELTLG
jgi:lysozyme